MKKKAALLIAFMMLLSTGCGGTASSEQSNQPEKPSAASNPVEESVENSTEKAGSELEIAPFEEITAVDNDQCAIRITGIEPDNMWGYTIKAYLENRSSDKTYMYSVETAAINGVQVDPLFAAEVAAGKKSNEEINFPDSELTDNGMNEYTDIELTFRVYDSDDWTADDVAKETVHIYPYGEEKATKYVRENQPADVIIADDENMTVVVTGYEEESIWGFTVNLYLVNKTDRELMFSVDEASVNGFMADPFWASSVGADKAEFTSMSWLDSDLEENGITAVEEIEMQFRVYDAEDWMADDLMNETVTLKP